MSNGCEVGSSPERQFVMNQSPHPELPRAVICMSMYRGHAFHCLNNSETRLWAASVKPASPEHRIRDRTERGVHRYFTVSSAVPLIPITFRSLPALVKAHFRDVDLFELPPPEARGYEKENPIESMRDFMMSPFSIRPARTFY